VTCPIHSHTRLGLPRGLLVSTKSVYAFISSMRATCPAHLNLLDLICPTSSEEWRFWSASLCSFLQISVTSSPWGHVLKHLQTYFLFLRVRAFLHVPCLQIPNAAINLYHKQRSNQKKRDTTRGKIHCTACSFYKRKIQTACVKSAAPNMNLKNEQKLVPRRSLTVFFPCESSISTRLQNTATAPAGICLKKSVRRFPTSVV
jgi:hypothetical protein